jgi:AcrR family transcriptional regulator
MTETRRDRRAERHTATKREILDAAWRLARERGLAGWSLRDVADAVGMRAPSLYVYFDSKNALYDAMFAEGYAELLAALDALRSAAGDVPPVELLRRGASVFVDFCVEDPARYQLLFLRTLPGFEPTPASYALATDVLEQSAAVLTTVGIGAPEQVDLWTALLAGLATQQISNDPGGDRWRRLVDRAVDMFLSTTAGSPAS